MGSPASWLSRLPAGLVTYASAAAVARSATEAIAPAVLLVGVGTGQSPSRAALLLSCYVGTGAISGPFVGQFLDRTPHPKRSLMFAMGMFAAALVALAIGLGRWPFWLLALVAALAGLGQPAPTSGWTAQLPRVVTASRLSGAYGIDAATYSIGMIAGPALAGAAFAVAHRAPLYVPAVFLIAAIAVLARVRINPLTHTVATDTSLRHGFVVVLRSPPLLRTSIVSTIGFAGQSALVASAPLVSSGLGAGLALIGPLLVAFAAGGLISTLYLARRPSTNPERWVDLGTYVVALGFVGLALATNTFTALLGAFVIGVGDGPMFTSTLRIRAREAPPGVRGQVFATAASLRIGSYALALAGFGAILWTGAAVVLWLAAAVQLIAVALGWWLPRYVKTPRSDAQG